MSPAAESATAAAAPSIIDLVNEGARIKSRMKEDAARLKSIEADLIQKGAGRYAGTGDAAALVIEPKDGIKPTEEDIEAARGIIGDVDTFKKLFDRVVSYKPVKAFGEVAGALLTPGKVKKLLECVTKAGAAYVKWNS